MTAMALSSHRENQISSNSTPNLPLNKLKEQVQDNISWLIFLSELKINKWDAFSISSGLVKVFELVGSIEWGYKIEWNRKVLAEENAKKEIEVWLIYDMENWKLDEVNHIKVSPDYLLHLFIQWALSVDEIRKIRVIDNIIIVKNLGFNLWSKTKYFNLVCSKDITTWFATFDKNWNIIM